MILQYGWRAVLLKMLKVRVFCFASVSARGLAKYSSYSLIFLEKPDTRLHRGLWLCCSDKVGQNADTKQPDRRASSEIIVLASITKIHDDDVSMEKPCKKIAADWCNKQC